MNTRTKTKPIYQTVTANLNTDGSPSIIAWRGNAFDVIPLSDGKGGTIARVVPADALHLAAPDLLAALQEVASENMDALSDRDELIRCATIARRAIAKATAEE